MSDADSEIETTQHAEYDSTAPANTGPRPEFMLIAGLPHLRRSVDIAGIDATAPATAGTGLKKEIRRSEINRFIVSCAVLVAPAATTPRDAHGLGTSDGDWRSFYDGVLQHLPKRMETNEGPQPRSSREAPDFWEPESWGLTHRGWAASASRYRLPEPDALIGDANEVACPSRCLPTYPPACPPAHTRPEDLARAGA